MAGLFVRSEHLGDDLADLLHEHAEIGQKRLERLRLFVQRGKTRVVFVVACEDPPITAVQFAERVVLLLRVAQKIVVIIQFVFDRRAGFAAAGIQLFLDRRGTFRDFCRFRAIIGVGNEIKRAKNDQHDRRKAAVKPRALIPAANLLRAARAAAVFARFSALFRRVVLRVLIGRVFLRRLAVVVFVRFVLRRRVFHLIRRMLHVAGLCEDFALRRVAQRRFRDDLRVLDHDVAAKAVIHLAVHFIADGSVFFDRHDAEIRIVRRFIFGHGSAFSFGQIIRACSSRDTVP